MRFLATLAAAALLLVAPVPALAWSAILSWGAVPNASSYKVEKSTDTGATWVSVGTPATPAYTYTGTEVGLVFFRVSACNATGCVVRGGDGLWHNEAWTPPTPAQNLGVQ